MSLRKVYGGTPIGSESRCDTCTHARIIQGYAESERIIICTGMYDPIRVPFKVMQCTDYEDRRLPDFKRVGGCLVWEKDFPRTAAMKIKRLVLAEEIRKTLSRAAVVEL